MNMHDCKVEIHIASDTLQYTLLCMHTQILLSQLKKADELEEKLEESNKKILVS